jgi:transposase
MRNDLHTFATTLLPPVQAVCLSRVMIEKASIQFQLITTALAAACPLCHMPSSPIHSRNQRHLTDLPWGARLVRLELMVRKFVCRNVRCARRIFTERLPDLVEAWS